MQNQQTTEYSYQLYLDLCSLLSPSMHAEEKALEYQPPCNHHHLKNPLVSCFGLRSRELDLKDRNGVCRSSLESAMSPFFGFVALESICAPLIV